MMTKRARDWRAGVVSELRHGPWCEDHYRLVTVWGVVVTNEVGRKLGYCGPVPTETREQAQTLADRINGYITLDNPDWSPDLKPDFWNEMDPVYGSEEYERQGTEMVRAERERAEDPWYYRDAVRLAHSC